MSAIKSFPSAGQDHTRFLAAIRRAVRDPGTRAALRRGVGRRPEQAQQMHMVVAPWLPDHPSPALERAYYAVASLLANVPRGRSEGETDPQKAGAPINLGASFAEAVRSGLIREDTGTAHLHLLCRQGLDGIHKHLPRAVARLQAARARISWEQLLTDLAAWNHYRDQIAKRWLQSYYRNLRSASEADSTPPAQSLE